jgi:regulator of sigma E protease
MPYESYEDKPVQVVALPSTATTGANSLQVGDTVLSVNGVATPKWEEAEKALKQVNPNQTAKIEVENNGVRRTVESTPKDVTQAEHLLGYLPLVPIVDYVEPGKPAKRAGLREDDVITGIDGQKIRTWEQFVERVRGSGGKALSLEIARKGQTIQTTIIPELGPSETGDQVYQIGVQRLESVSYRKVSFSQSVREARLYTVDNIERTIGVVGKLFSGRVSVRQLQSVVGISRAAGHAVKRGPLNTILLMAFMSVNLGILNLLPIPILDGGNILLLTLEGIRRRDFSLGFKERFVQVGLVFLLVLFAIVMYNDVIKLFPPHS